MKEYSSKEVVLKKDVIYIKKRGKNEKKIKIENPVCKKNVNLKINNSLSKIEDE